MSKNYKTLWKQELKNNPQLFETKIISTHTSRKDAYEKENKLQIQLNVVESCMYINMANANPKGTLGGGFVGGKHSESHKSYMSNLLKNRNASWLKGVSRPKHSAKMTGIGNPNFGKRHIGHPTLGRQMRICCTICHLETTTSTLTRVHKNCTNTFSISEIAIEPAIQNMNYLQ